MKNVLKIFLDNEKAVFKLYTLYSEKFSKITILWDELIEKETEHVEILENLYEKYRHDETIFEVSRHLKEALSYVGNFVKDQTQIAKNKKIELIDAAEVGLRLERSMIEKRSSELFKPKEKEILKALKKLNRDTRDHIRMIEKDIKRNNY